MCFSPRVRALACACLLAPALGAEPASAGVWTEIPSATPNTITAIEYQSATRFWFTTSAGAIYTRRPDGSFAQTRAPSGVPLNDIEFQPGGPIGLAVGNGGQVLRSTDAGASWTAIADIPVSGSSGILTPYIDCLTSAPLHDVSAVRFAGSQRAWIFAAGRQIATSQAPDVGAQGTWVDANRDPQARRCKVPLGLYEDGYADAFFVPSNPDVGYIVASDGYVFFTANNLATPAALKAPRAGHRLTGDPQDPRRMWSTAADQTRDGWQSEAGWKIGNPKARVYPSQGPLDVDFAGGTVLAAGTAGLILNSIDGETFYYGSADGPLATQRWTAASLASASDGAIGGDNGKLAITSQANLVPAPTPVPTPTITPAPTPQPRPVAGRSWVTGPVSGRVLMRRGGRSVALATGQSVPVNTNVDARSGTITITVATNTGTTQTATLTGGIFRVTQAPTTPSLALRTPPGKGRACAVRRPPKGSIRSLKGTVRGTFHVIGGAGTATVRDGTWTLRDTCTGTTLRNIRGHASIKGKHARRGIAVKPGRRYLLKARLFGLRRSARRAALTRSA